MSTLTAMPDTFAAGTTLKYTRSLPDYPASAGWGLTLYLNGKNVLSRSGSANGDAFDITLSYADTRTLAAGDYLWIEQVSKGGEKYNAGSGRVTVTLDLVTALAGDSLSQDERELEIVNAAIEKRLTADIESYQIENTAVSKIPLEKLTAIRNQLIVKINRKRLGGKAAAPLQVVFNGAGVDSTTAALLAAFGKTSP